jgi:integrase
VRAVHVLRKTLAPWLAKLPARVNRHRLRKQVDCKVVGGLWHLLLKGLTEKGGNQTAIHSHLLRHQMLTWLTANGIADAKIQLISGHESKKSLEVYQHLSLDSVKADYHKAARQMEALLNGHGEKAFPGLIESAFGRGGADKPYPR